MSQAILKYLSNLPGWRTNRKIVVIESDDWGSIRMPSNNAREKLDKHGLNLDKGKESYRYNLYDTLASAEDLEALFETLSSFKDKNGKPPVFTAVSLVANPDFEKIKETNYLQYFYEPFTNTLARYQQENVWSMWQQGKEEGLFHPEFHGREHLNVPVWLRALQQGNRETLLAFEQGCWGFKNKHQFGIKYQAAFALEKEVDIPFQKQAIEEGLELFESLHGSKAEFFVPPNGPFNNSLEKVASQKGIKYMSASKIQREELGEGKTRKVLHWLGQKNKQGQRYLTRNCFFEPSDASKDWVDSCLNEIQLAFNWKKPAVISSHRVNFIGGLNEKNRTEGLEQLKSLLSTILKKWPEVEFMTSSDLGKLISQ